MRYQKEYNYYVYIITNKHKTVLYTGVTNSLVVRLHYHKQGILNRDRSFSARYKLCHLVYWERFDYVRDAIFREKQIKGWSRAKKEVLIARMNPEWNFLNEEVLEMLRVF